MANFDQDEILEEQLTRNVQFFGLEAQRRIGGAFVVVVGLGVSWQGRDKGAEWRRCPAAAAPPLNPAALLRVNSNLRRGEGPCDRAQRSGCPASPRAVQGVGSHAAHLLLRSGVGRLRLIDFDQVGGLGLACHAVPHDVCSAHNPFTHVRVWQ